MIAMLKVFLAPVVSVVLISIVSDLAWTFAQTLGVANVQTGFAIDVATVTTVVLVLFGWTLSLPNDIAEALKLEEDYQ